MCNVRKHTPVTDFRVAHADVPLQRRDIAGGKGAVRHGALVAPCADANLKVSLKCILVDPETNEHSTDEWKGHPNHSCYVVLIVAHMASVKVNKH